MVTLLGMYMLDRDDPRCQTIIRLLWRFRQPNPRNGEEIAVARNRSVPAAQMSPRGGRKSTSGFLAQFTASKFWETARRKRVKWEKRGDVVKTNKMILPLFVLLLLSFFAVPALGAVIDIDLHDDNTNIYIDGADPSGGMVFDLDVFNAGNDMFDIELNATYGGLGSGLNFYAEQALIGYTTDWSYAEVHAGVLGGSYGMNIRFDESMYVTQLERKNTGLDLVYAGGFFYDVGWEVGIKDGAMGNLLASGLVDVSGSGSCALDTNQWHSTGVMYYGWGNPDGFVAPNPPSYYTPVNTITATGSGVYTQIVSGTNEVTLGGLTVPGPVTIPIIFPFTNGISGVIPNMAGK